MGNVMAKQWAKVFYNSQQWLDCRAAYIASVYGLCETCSGRGETTPGYILHHMIWLTPNNINDPNISLNHEHLRYECLECHNKSHRKQVQGLLREGLRFTPGGDLVEII